MICGIVSRICQGKRIAKAPKQWIGAFMLACIENQSPQPEQGKNLRGFHPHRVRISTAAKADFTHALHGFHPPQVDLFGFHNVARIEGCGQHITCE